MRLFASCRTWLASLTLLFHLIMYSELALGESVRYARAQTQSQESSCSLKEQICVDGPSTKVINGVSVTKDCWEYRHTYECLEPDSADYCNPLKQTQAQCEVTGQTCLQEKDGVCLRYTHQYSCDVNLKTLHNNTLPDNVSELEHEHLITSEWDEKQCQAQGKSCRVVETRCLDGAATKEINGVPVTKECWREERTMQCGGTEQNECRALEQDASCTPKSSKCVYQLSDGTCQIQEQTFVCTEPASTQQVSTCQDRDFARTMTTMEMAREMQRFYDPDLQRFFNGEPNKCSIKLGGALDGVFGGDCCKTEADPGNMKDSALRAGVQFAIDKLVETVASHYTYTTLTGQAANYLATALSSAGVTGVAVSGGSAATGAAAGTATSMTGGIGAFGFTVGPSATSATGLTMGFDPVSFGVAIAIMALQQWLKCSQSDILTAMKRKAGLCHYVGSYCGAKAFGACTTSIESQCCYVSKLVKIINVGGRTQMGLGFGTPENPQCEGFTAQEMEKLDFSKLDLGEFYQEIYANMRNLPKQTGHAKQQAVQNIGQGKNPRVKNYYEN